MKIAKHNLFFSVVLYLNLVFLGAIDALIVINILLEGKDPGYLNSIAMVLILIWICWCLLFLISALRIFFDTIKHYKSGDSGELLENMRQVKLVTFPYFILNVFLLGAPSLFLLAISHGFGIFFTFVPFFLTFCLRFPTSLYGAAFLLYAFREKMIGTKYFFIYIALQFIFVADILSSLDLYKKFENKNDCSKADAVS